MATLDPMRRAALWLLRCGLSVQHRLHARLSPAEPAIKARAPYVLRHSPSTSDKLVMHFNGNFAVGGSTQLIVDLIELSSDIFRHEVVVPILPSPLPYQPVDVCAVPLDQMEGLRALLTQRRPSLVHIHYWSRAENRFDGTGVWYATVLAICNELGLPVVQNINVPTRPMQGVSIVTNVYVSDYVRTRFDEGCVPAEVIHPGSDFSHFAPSDGSVAPDSIGMVYRLDNDKLNERSIEPFILAAKARASLHCLIVGEGMFSSLYQERVEIEGVAGQIRFAGLVSYADLPAHYAEMGVFIAPVHNESFGQVTPFAMSMGLPVAGYDIGALAEILGTNATLVAAGDERALERLILELLEAPERRLEIGAANRRRALDLFSREKMVDRYRALYQRIINRSDTN